MNQLHAILELTLLYVPLALGIVVVFRIAKFPDLTVDGSFALGGAISAKLVLMGWPILSLPVSILVGAFAGLITAGLHVWLGINRILSGILVMFALYSVNLRLMGSANLQILNSRTAISFFESQPWPYLILFLLALSTVSLIVIMLFFRTEVGLHFRACGQNAQLIRDLGRNRDVYICLGPMIGNGLVALTGGLLAQRQGVADVNMGSGMLVTGLAFLFIGGAAVRSNRLTYMLLSAFVGTFVYETIHSVSLSIGLRASDLRVVTAILVILGLWLARQGKTPFEMEGVL